MNRQRRNVYRLVVILGLGLSLLFSQKASYANIILKVFAVNPSKEIEQEVPLKTFLPKEAKPENVTNRDNLTIKYDAEQGLFYAEKTVKLRPGESYTLAVDIEDIWIVSAEKLSKIHERADKAIDILKGTNSFDMANILYTNITSALEIIESRQTDDTQLPEEHIATYRNNMKMMDDCMKDLNSLEQFAIKVSSVSKTGPDSNSSNGFDIPISYTWKILLSIIGFLGLISAAFFAVWNKQLKDLSSTKEINILPPEERKE